MVHVRTFTANTLLVLVSIIIYNLSLANGNAYSIPPQYLERLLNSEKYEDVANILQIPSTHLINREYQKTDFDQLILYNGLPLSDILMRKGQLLNLNQNMTINSVIDVKFTPWKTRYIPYYITRSLYRENETEFIEGEINLHNSLVKPHIVFRPYRHGDNDYVIFYPGGCGCYANLGYVGGPQVVSLEATCLVKGAVLHRLQHVLGIGHVSNRYDRDQYIQVIPENIPELIIHGYTRYDSRQAINIGPYDYYSIVGFKPVSYGWNRPAFHILQNGVNATRVGLNMEMSKLDIRRVKKLYPL